MTQLTQMQIAEIKAEAENWIIERYPTEQSETILQLIATLEARDAAFDVVFTALQDIARQKTTYEYTDGGDDFEGGYDAYVEVARAAIAHAEKVK